MVERKCNLPFFVGRYVGMGVFPRFTCFVGEELGTLLLVGDKVGYQVSTPLEGDLDLYEGDFDLTYLVDGDALLDPLEGDFDLPVLVVGAFVLRRNLVVGALDLRRNLVGDGVGSLDNISPPPPPL